MVVALFSNFNQLEHLKLCVCKDHSSDLLGQLLKDSPNLRVLDVFHTGIHGFVEDTDRFAGNNLAKFLNVCCRVYKFSTGQGTLGEHKKEILRFTS